MKSHSTPVEQMVMEYQKRLKFIEYIKKNFIENDLGCKRRKTFLFENYEDIDSIRVHIFEHLDESFAHYKKHQFEDRGVCQFAYSNQDIPYLVFEDSFMIYQYNFHENCSDLNCLKDDLRSDLKSIQQQLESLIHKLNGEDLPQRIYNC